MRANGGVVGRGLVDDDGLAGFRFTAIDVVSKTLVLIPSMIFPLGFGVYKAFDFDFSRSNLTAP